MKNNYELFETICTEKTAEYIPAELLELGAKMKFNELKKVNTTLTGMSLTFPDSDIAPTVFIETLYAEFVKCSGFAGSEEQVYARIIKYLHDKVNWAYFKYKEQRNFASEFLNPETVKSRIVYRLVNSLKNKELLEKVPYRQSIGDLALVYCLVAEQELSGGEGNADLGIGSSLINHELAEHFKLTEEELYELAQANTSIVLPFVVLPITELYNCAFEGGSVSANAGMIDVNKIRRTLTASSEGCAPMLTVTNKYEHFGATCVLYDNFLSIIANIIDKDLVLIPSSVHNMIIMPYENERMLEVTSDMVADVNRTSVSPDEFLSNHVFVYKRKAGNIVTYNPCGRNFRMIRLGDTEFTGGMCDAGR